MAKEIIASPGSYRTWLCNVALLALVCVAFVAGLLLGPTVLSKGWSADDSCSSPHGEPIVHHKDTEKQSEHTACLSSKELSVILKNWSLSLEDAIEEKLANVSKWRINQATRKLSKAQDTSTKKTIKEMKEAIIANWTAQINNVVKTLLSGTTPIDSQSNSTENVIVGEKKKPSTPELEVIDVDTPDLPTPGGHISLPVPVALFPLNGKFSTWDISGRGNPNGVARGVRLAPGPEGHPDDSYQFSGKRESYIELPNTGALSTKGSITILVWIYVHTSHGSILTYNPHGWGVSLGVSSQRKLSATLMSHDFNRLSHMITDAPLKADAWSYVGVSYNYVTGMARLWVDGRATNHISIGSMIKLSLGRVVRLGSSPSDGGTFFNGRITRLQIYDRALSRREIDSVRGPIVAGACSQGWVGYHSSCYLLFNRLTKQWNQARQVCQEHGADLVKIGSSQENQFVYALARSKAPTRRYMWIGLLRGFPVERFSWVDEPFPMLYSNWATGEPNDESNRGENCGHMYIKDSSRATQWNDELCVNPTNGQMIFMCEKSAVEPKGTPEFPRPVWTGTSVDGEESGMESGSGEASGESECGDGPCTFFRLE